MVFPWLERSWADLQAMRGRLPQALVLHGAPGLGTIALALEFARALLCESPAAGGAACGRCPACNWFGQGNHPDFRLVQPDSLAPADPEEEPGKKKSEQIRIDQVRGLQGFLGVGTHRGGLRVIVLHPAEVMNEPTQNALLKSLEEPPPGTLFLLVTALPDRLLPTVLSRCRRIDIPLPDRRTAAAWLKGEGVDEKLLDAVGGAPLAAVDAAGMESARQAFLQRLREGALDPIAMSAQLQATPRAQVVAWLQRWTYDLLACRVAGVVRYHKSDHEFVLKLSSRSSASALARFLRRLGEAKELAEHPLNLRLYYEELLVEYGKLVGPGR